MDSLLFLAVGGFFGADVLAERWIRWVMYISPSSRVVLVRLWLDFLLVKISSVSFCPFQSFFTITFVRGV
uniref:Uncharacterized protein n=1 Tax=Setaria viridis TaxID=4556 RepID=A0A4U6W2C4_SETVI|nr:hypothetical protein SEVIR_2G388632v2 [Setaria viridis]